LLWTVGVYHGDPSLGNMALRIDERGKLHGVLTDWDLATVEELGAHHGDRRTGTRPFMAIDILCDQYWDGLIPRVYRHELEGFVWILPWVFFQYQDKKCTPHRIFKRWVDRDVLIIRSVKRDFYIEVGRPVPMYTPRYSWEEQWPLVPYTMCTLNRLNLLRQDLAYELHPDTIDPTIQSWVQFPATKEFTTIQLEYLVVWKNIARSLPPEKATEYKEDVGLDVDINDDTILEQSYLALFAKPHWLRTTIQTNEANEVLAGSEERGKGKQKAVQ
jgi:hypothetical protein